MSFPSSSSSSSPHSNSNGVFPLPNFNSSHRKWINKNVDFDHQRKKMKINFSSQEGNQIHFDENTNPNDNNNPSSLSPAELYLLSVKQERQSIDNYQKKMFQKNNSHSKNPQNIHPNPQPQSNQKNKKKKNKNPREKDRENHNNPSDPSIVLPSSTYIDGNETHSPSSSPLPIHFSSSSSSSSSPSPTPFPSPFSNIPLYITDPASYYPLPPRFSPSHSFTSSLTKRVVSLRTSLLPLVNTVNPHGNPNPLSLNFDSRFLEQISLGEFIPSLNIFKQWTKSYKNHFLTIMTKKIKMEIMTKKDEGEEDVEDNENDNDNDMEGNIPVDKKEKKNEEENDQNYEKEMKEIEENPDDIDDNQNDIEMNDENEQDDESNVHQSAPSTSPSSLFAPSLSIDYSPSLCSTPPPSLSPFFFRFLFSLLLTFPSPLSPSTAATCSDLSRYLYLIREHQIGQSEESMERIRMCNVILGVLEKIFQQKIMV